MCVIDKLRSFAESQAPDNNLVPGMTYADVRALLMEMTTDHDAERTGPCTGQLPAESGALVIFSRAQVVNGDRNTGFWSERGWGSLDDASWFYLEPVDLDRESPVNISGQADAVFMAPPTRQSFFRLPIQTTKQSGVVMFECWADNFADARAQALAVHPHMSVFAGKCQGCLP